MCSFPAAVPEVLAFPAVGTHPCIGVGGGQSDLRQTDRVGTPAHGFSVQWIKVMLTVSGRPGTHEK